MWKGIIDKYREFLPVTENTPVVTLNEGNTPLVYSRHLSELIDGEVYLKYEGLNPTGSFKDRGMTMAISKSLEENHAAVMCASTGNTSASAAAYSARAGIKCIVLIPKGAIALGKLAQALIHGAQVIAVDGNFDDALNLAKEITAKHHIQLVNSINPYRIEGQKTGSFEICDQLGFAPDFHAIPVGNAGNITAYWKGYKEYKEKGKIKNLPVMLGFQAEGAAPIVRGSIVEKPETIATAIRIGNPASWKMAEAARDESKGLIDMVSDDEILDAYKFLAAKEGVFVEPASAASVAGVIKLNKKGCFKKFQKPKLVCILTGHGLKDPDRAIKSIKEPKVVPANLQSVLKEIL
ncbi:MAG: threonine synthase [Candidatus Omnitrophica bacterium CG_4_9_14_0_2_um_filter_42_8]|nr:MAG: threonine synthase [Candidatus Omnitrophica bacterium CG22_combo_CG10-13_8_21_14_all_43_16]PJC48742.1 MAG: threonine synthase [Candidatus Omnitrophica bacterium CG_4_9_14_0_2_um_filter_42_8]